MKKLASRKNKTKIKTQGLAQWQVKIKKLVLSKSSLCRRVNSSKNHFALEDSAFEILNLVFLPERKIPLYFVNRGLVVKPHFCLIFCVLYEVHVQCMQIYEVVYGRRFSWLIAAEGRDVPPRETSFSGDERGKTSAVRRLRSNTFLWYCLLRCTRWFYLLSL